MPAAGMTQRGTAQGDVAKLIGGNYLRLLAEVQTV